MRCTLCLSPSINNQLNIHNSTEQLCPTHSGCWKIHIGISKGRWAGTQRRAGTRTTAQVVPTVPAPANLVEPAAPENPVAAEEKVICPGAPAAVVPTDTGQWVSATEEPGSLPSSHRGIHSAGLHPPPFSAAPTNTTVLQMAEVP